MVSELGGTPRVAAGVAEALRDALDAASPDDVVLVTGSLYTVGAARAAARSIEGLTVT